MLASLKEGAAAAEPERKSHALLLHLQAAYKAR